MLITDHLPLIFLPVLGCTQRNLGVKPVRDSFVSTALILIPSFGTCYLVFGTLRETAITPHLAPPREF